ncbi:hypothetical protein SCHPADRAFT_822557 [Schizopora paradoxa]|uniref:MYND-type domain-containing protein n=1 Tax=Schizopora paradoxa TaxID=27342 RepID=A0A0H2RYK7_9AGAM|nr:hypothetical protein SCHPADRAFT_822557 [Schizopora paradoxa]
METKQVQDTAGRVCPVCNTLATKRCSRCATVYYCSVEHQTEHWSDHKAECKKLQRSNAPPASTSTPQTLTAAQKNAQIPKSVGSMFTVDAILFPADEDRPRIVQMGFEVKSADDGGNGLTDTWHLYDMSYFERLLGDRMVGRSTVYFQKPGGAPIPDGYTLELVYRDNYANDGSKVNRCVQNLTGGNTVHSFRGNLLALRRPGSSEGGIPSDLVVNVEDADLEYMKNYFIGYGRKAMHHPDSLGANPSWLSSFGNVQVLNL